MQALTVDIESRSRADLECCGSTKYAQHPTTEVLCVRYGFDVDHIDTWQPGQPVPEAFRRSDMNFAAQRAGFEMAMFRYVMPRHGFPLIADRRWSCTAAAAGYAGLPQGLGKISDRLDLGEYGKDTDGHSNMLQLCKPFNKKIKRPRRKKGEPKPLPEPGEIATLIDGVFEGGEFNNDPEKLEKNVEYCGQDVVAEITMASQLPAFPGRERRTWLLHNKINARGVPVDVELCRGAVKIIKHVSAQFMEELADITDGTITTANQIDRIKLFCKERGVTLPNLQEPTVTEILPTVQDDTARRVLEIRLLLNAAAVKKFQATLDCVGPDGRCRDMHTYYGAGPGRWAGALAQFQNLIRPDLDWETIEKALPFIAAGDYAEIEKQSGGQVFRWLCNSVRPILCAPPGRKFTISDFSGIEARVVAWLAGATGLLSLFTSGVDPYVPMACSILQCKPDDVVNPETKKADTPERAHRRRIGKSPFLGAQYQMSGKKLVGTAKKAGIPLELNLANTIIETFRNDFPEIPAFWRDIERGAKYCAKTGKTVSHPMFRFRMHGQWLVMRIPGGRELFYFNPRFEWNDKGREELVYDSPRGCKQLYGGLLTENITQATARDLLVDSMFRQDAMNLETIMHCHDETVVESDADDDKTPALVHWTMTQNEAWSDGIPIGAETHDSTRYNK